jgi:NACalpha-BTF3-like transcription factor
MYTEGMNDPKTNEAFFEMIAHPDMADVPGNDPLVAKVMLDPELYTALVDRMQVEISRSVVNLHSSEGLDDEERRTDMALDAMEGTLMEKYGVTKDQARKAIQAADNDLHRTISK